MYGRYTKDLGEYAKDEARRLKQLERQRKKDDRARDKVNTHARFKETSTVLNIEYKATVVGTFRNFSEADEKERFFAPYLGAGDTHLQGWVRTGFS